MNDVFLASSYLVQPYDLQSGFQMIQKENCFIFLLLLPSNSPHNVSFFHNAWQYLKRVYIFPVTFNYKCSHIVGNTACLRFSKQIHFRLNLSSSYPVVLQPCLSPACAWLGPFWRGLGGCLFLYSFSLHPFPSLTLPQQEFHAGAYFLGAKCLPLSALAVCSLLAATGIDTL